MEKKVGGVKQIIAPNCVLLTGPVSNETGLPHTKFLTLQGIQTPEFNLMDKENPKQESFGYKAREFLRRQLLGAQVEFTVEHKIKDSNDKVIGRVFKNGQDVGESLLKEGLAQLRPGGKPSQNYEDAVHAAKSAKKGIWAAGDNLIKLNKINPQEVVHREYSQCLVEDVAGLYVFYAYVNELQGLVKCAFGDIFMPSASANLQGKAKWILQDLILQQEVTLQFLGFEEKYQAARVDVFKGKVDIKKELISLGFFKLTPNAYTLMDQKRYTELRELQASAELKGQGIWRDNVKPGQTGSVVKQGKSVLQAKVVEVHSGDSLTVLNSATREQQRVFLASIKAPKYGRDSQPFGYEAKEFLRKHAIGKSVRVELEYEKKIQPKLQESSDEESNKHANKKPLGPLTMQFGNIILLDEKEQNVAALVVQAGLAAVQPPKGDDGLSRHMEELKAAQEIAEKGKKGIFGKQNPPIPKLNDLSVNTQVKRSKDTFENLQQIRKLTGVVELVLNGSRLKVRFNEINCQSIVLLAGVRCLPNDQNLPDYQKFSNIAMQYSKENLLQRDVEIELESIDKRGIFHGHVFVGKRINFGMTLLELGLAVTFNPVANSHKYCTLFNDAESKAKLQAEGLWGLKNLDLSIVKGDDEVTEGTSTFKQLNGQLQTLVLVEIADSNVLYFQDGASKQLTLIEKALSTFEATEANKLVPPFKKGFACVAKFSVDNKWYRARVLRELKNKYEVLFVDYGNADTVVAANMRKTPDTIVALPVQAVRCNLAYLSGPTLDHELGQDVGEFIREQIFEREVVVQQEYTDDISVGVVVYLTKEKLPNKTLNYLLLQLGYAKLNKKHPQLPQKYSDWVKVQEEAESSGKGVWGYDEDDQ